ncbi:MAG: hypothetical protein AAGH88_00835 [Planctomycetota bacterium]
MDDTRTRQKLDDLADLFLTGMVDDLEAMPKPESQSPPVSAPTSDLLQGPAPIRLAPKLAGQAPATPPDVVPDPSQPIQGPAQTSNPPDDDDSHPMLRLTSEDGADLATAEAAVAEFVQAPTQAEAPASSTETPKEQKPPAPATPAKAVVEAVVMGNLPGLAGPWLTQYAQLIAQNDGPVAILHVGDDTIDLELVEPRDEALPAPRRPTATLRVPPMRDEPSGLIGLLEALVRAQTGPAQTVLVRLAPTTDPRDLSRLAAIDDWTLLCGSDGGSMAGGRQMIQQLTQADPRLSGKHVGVMVMGSDEEAASNAAKQLAQTTGDMLVEPVSYIGHLQRMQPVQARELGSFPDPVSLWPRLVAWLDGLELPEPSPTTTAPPTPGPEASTRRDQAPARPTEAPPPPTTTTTRQPASADPLRSTPAGRPGQFHVPKPPPPAAVTRRQSSTQPPPGTPRASQPAATRPPRTSPPAQPRAQAPQPTSPQRPHAAPTPRPAASAEPTATPRNLRPLPRIDFAALLADTPAAIQGATPLEARIPHQRSAQLVVDGQGVIHILTRHVSQSDDPEDGDPRRAILDLIDARRWVSEHLELLALTQRDHDFTTAEPTLHLLTDRADLATGLVTRLGQSLRLHLLQQVTLGPETGWFCTPLN